jgi:hypothetical protein
VDIYKIEDEEGKKASKADLDGQNKSDVRPLSRCTAGSGQPIKNPSSVSSKTPEFVGILIVDSVNES